jgi:hypothetical protein
MMYLALGVGLLSAAVLLFVWAYAAHRRRVPARWTGREFLSSGICIVITGLLPIGGGYLAVAVMHPLGTIRSLGAASFVLLVVSVVACWVLIPRLLKSVPSAASTPGSAPPRSPKPRLTSGPRQAAPVSRASKRAA